MRIGTWNVAYGVGQAANRLRIAKLGEIDADVWVLTETHDGLSPGEVAFKAVPGAQRPLGDGRNKKLSVGSRWVTIWSRLQVEEIVLPRFDPRRVAAKVTLPDGSVLAVYGTVLPWTTDRETDGMEAVLAEQLAEWRELKATYGALCLAGDFNVNLGGPHYYGSNASKAAVEAALKAADLEAVTRFERTKPRPYGLIDHIAVSTAEAACAGRPCIWERTNASGAALSDHSGVAVDVGACR